MRRIKSPVPAEAELFALREMATRKILAWLRDFPEKKDALREGLGGLAEVDMDLAQTVAKGFVLRCIGTLDHEPGADMAVHVGLLEAGLSLIDWTRVVWGAAK